MEAAEAELARASKTAAELVTTGLKDDLRAATMAAGLGSRAANTWRSETYPKKPSSLDPSSYVYSNWAKAMRAFTTGATIRPLGGKRFLWIPTANVPNGRGRGGRARPMTPFEVETYFNQDLVVLRGRRGRFLAFINAVRGRSGKEYRPATKGRVAQGRATVRVLMFVLTPNVTLAKRIDLQAIADRWAGQGARLLSQELQADGGAD